MSINTLAKGWFQSKQSNSTSWTILRFSPLRDLAGGNLVFVGSEGYQDLGLLRLRDFEEVQVRPSSPARTQADRIYGAVSGDIAAET
jgi:hypothetical protein